MDGTYLSGQRGQLQSFHPGDEIVPVICILGWGLFDELKPGLIIASIDIECRSQVVYVRNCNRRWLKTTRNFFVRDC